MTAVGGWRGVDVVLYTTPPVGLHRVSARYSALGVSARINGTYAAHRCDTEPFHLIEQFQAGCTLDIPQLFFFFAFMIFFLTLSLHHMIIIGAP